MSFSSGDIVDLETWSFQNGFSVEEWEIKSLMITGVTAVRKTVHRVDGAFPGDNALCEISKAQLDHCSLPINSRLSELRDSVGVLLSELITSS